MVGYVSELLSSRRAVDLALEVAGELLERIVELAGELGGADDGDVVAGKHPRCARRSRRRSSSRPAGGAACRRALPASSSIAFSSATTLERVEDRHTRAQERRHLAREVHDFFGLDRPADVELALVPRLGFGAVGRRASSAAQLRGASSVVLIRTPHRRRRASRLLPSWSRLLSTMRMASVCSVRRPCCDGELPRDAAAGGRRRRIGGSRP